jgi:hypothetical protein
VRQKASAVLIQEYLNCTHDAEVQEINAVGDLSERAWVPVDEHLPGVEGVIVVRGLTKAWGHLMPAS